MIKKQNCFDGSAAPQFDVICDLLLERPTAIWYMFVLNNREAKLFDGDVTYASVLR